jgi:hypothetical protein
MTGAGHICYPDPEEVKRLEALKGALAVGHAPCRAHLEVAESALAESQAELERLSRDAIAGVLRDWIHTTPLSLCNASVDTCPDWDLAYEVADKIVARAALRSPEGRE